MDIQIVKETLKHIDKYEIHKNPISVLRLKELQYCLCFFR